MSDAHPLSRLFGIDEVIKRSALGGYLQGNEKRVLFVGSNNYHLLGGFASRFPHARFYGFDGRSHVVTAARKLFEEKGISNVEYFTVESFEDFAFRSVSPDFSFDVIVLLPSAFPSKSIPNARASRNASCSHCHRFLKPGGILVMCGLMGKAAYLDAAVPPELGIAPPSAGPLTAWYDRVHGSSVEPNPVVWQGGTMRSLMEHYFMRAVHNVCPDAVYEHPPFFMEIEWCLDILERVLRMQVCMFETWVPTWITHMLAADGKEVLDTMHAEGVVVVRKL